MSGDLLRSIQQCASDAEAVADSAIGFSELPSDDPTLIALKGAHNALMRIRLAAEVSEVLPMDEGEL